MQKYRNASDAEEWAVSHGQRWGVCVFDGHAYAGTEEELRKIGVVVQPAVEILARHIDGENIEPRLFLAGNEYRVRVRDLDAGKNVTIVCCRDREAAERLYLEAVNAPA